MKRIAILATIFCLSIGAAAAQRIGALRVQLSPAQEVPEILSNAEGSFGIAFDSDLAGADVNLRVFGNDIVAAHLHCAPAGVNGPVVVNLLVPGPVDARGNIGTDRITNGDVIPMTVEQCGVEINNIASLLQAVRENRIYVNVHSIQFPPGVLRAQLWGYLLR